MTVNDYCYMVCHVLYMALSVTCEGADTVHPSSSIHAGLATAGHVHSCFGPGHTTRHTVHRLNRLSRLHNKPRAAGAGRGRGRQTCGLVLTGCG